MNILSFDLEEWYNEKQNFGGREWRYKIFDDSFSKLMQELNDHNLKATFFCVGKLTELRPNLLKQIADNGHEIGCHSNVHTWLNKMSPEQCEEDTRIAVDSLEQCVGAKVKSYRAPAFSIGASNPWAFEILAKNGIENDASIFPAVRNYGGFTGFSSDTPCIVNHNGIQIREFPICVDKFMGHDLIFSGGGYFRLLPLWFIRRHAEKRDYSIWYFHLNDMISEAKRVFTKDEYEKYFNEPGTLKARYSHYLKITIGSGKAFEKISKLMDNYQFVNIEQAVSDIDWNAAKVINV